MLSYGRTRRLRASIGAALLIGLAAWLPGFSGGAGSSFMSILRQTPPEETNVAAAAQALPDAVEASLTYLWDFMATTNAAFDPARALAQHRALQRALSTELPTVCFPGDPDTPDAVFPNNVFATVPQEVIAVDCLNFRIIR